MERINYLFIFLLLASCEGKQGEIGPMGSISLINIENELPGDNCSSGGFRIETGVDINNNKILEEDEIQSTEYICNGNDGVNGHNSLINVTEEISGNNCTSGGLKIEVGIDINNNGILDSVEVQSTHYICNGDGAKEVRLDFNMSSNASWSTSTSRVFYEFNGIPDFNINNFKGVDSIVFGAYVQSSNTNTNCILELYDNTNNTVIENSSISTNSSSYVWKTTTTNFIDKLPNEPIDLRLQMISDNGASVSFKVPRLILVWK